MRIKNILRIIFVFYISIWQLSFANAGEEGEIGDKKNLKAGIGEEKTEKRIEEETWGIKGNFKSWGAIFSLSSAYFESLDTEYIIFPFIDHPFFKYQGFQKSFGVNENWTITPSLTYSGNYSRDSDDLSGVYRELDSTSGSIEAGLKVSANFDLYSLELGMKSDVSSTYKGNRYYLTLEGRKALNQKIFQMLTYSLTYNSYSENFMNYYFAISEEDANELGIDEYIPEAGDSLALNLSLIKMINAKWSVIFSTEFEHLSDEAESEILKTQNQASVTTVLIWTPN